MSCSHTNLAMTVEEESYTSDPPRQMHRPPASASTICVTRPATVAATTTVAASSSTATTPIHVCVVDMMPSCTARAQSSALPLAPSGGSSSSIESTHLVMIAPQADWQNGLPTSDDRGANDRGDNDKGDNGKGDNGRSDGCTEVPPQPDPEGVEYAAGAESAAERRYSDSIHLLRSSSSALEESCPASAVAYVSEGLKSAAAHSGLMYVEGVSSEESLTGPVCRICQGEEEKGNPFVSPCRCSGTVRYIHGHCLRKWLEYSKVRKRMSNNRGQPLCELCGYKYVIRKKLKFTSLKLPHMTPFDRVLHIIFLFCLVTVIVSSLFSLVAIQMSKYNDLDPAGNSTAASSGSQGKGLSAWSADVATPMYDVPPDSIYSASAGMISGIIGFFAFFLGIVCEFKAKRSVLQVAHSCVKANQVWVVQNYRPPVARSQTANSSSAREPLGGVRVCPV